MTGGGVMTGGVMSGGLTVGACGGDFLAILRGGNDLEYAAFFISLYDGTYCTRFSDSLNCLSGALTSGSVLADAPSIESS